MASVEASNDMSDAGCFSRNGRHKSDAETIRIIDIEITEASNISEIIMGIKYWRVLLVQFMFLQQK